MARKLPSRRLRIDQEIAKSLEDRMFAMARREELSQFVEWLCALYLRGWLIESPDYHRTIGDGVESQLREGVEEARSVRKVVGAKGTIEDDQAKRKAS